mmetsp:Transcript_17435/g.35209  ORF Transcript_17435/g.35209 Transcript_17435/m.35209 type:complete len:96 (-) Transcript_17435:2-289(-)
MMLSPFQHALSFTLFLLANTCSSNPQPSTRKDVVVAITSPSKISRNPEMQTDGDIQEVLGTKTDDENFTNISTNGITKTKQTSSCHNEGCANCNY